MLTESVIGISEVCSLCGVDTTALAASLILFPGGLACHGRSKEPGGEIKMRLLKSRPNGQFCTTAGRAAGSRVVSRVWIYALAAMGAMCMGKAQLCGIVVCSGAMMW